MSRRARVLVLLPALALVGVVVVAGFTGLPDFGHYRGPYGDIVNHATVPERHITNAVTATVFDYRGFDTLGEELILFTAVMGVVLLLREQGEHPPEPAEDPARTASLRLLGPLLLAAVFLVGLWLVAFGYVTPGGGFQGGVILAGAVLLLYLTRGYLPWHATTHEFVLDPVEGTGAGGYIVVGLVALLSGSAYLHNLIGGGSTGTLLSGGSIGLLNGATALEVVAANLILFREFLKTYLGGEE